MIGGCRFAGNLAVMPDGAVYGWVPAEEAVALVRAHRAGEGNLTHLRGVLGATPAEQAALAAVASGLGVTHWDRRLTATVVSTARGWTVTVRLDGRPVREVRGHDAVRAPHELTCGSGRPSKAIVPTVDAVAPVAH